MGTTTAPHTDIPATTEPAAALGNILDAERPVVVEVGAHLAALMLGLNGTNRKLRRERVLQISRDIRTHRWVWDATPVCFDTTGQLVAGQHRLSALVEAAKSDPGLTLTMLVVNGVSPDAVLTSNSGLPTSPSDVLSIAGHRYTARLAPAARLHRAYANGDLVHSQVSIGGNNARMTNQEMLEHVEQHPGLVDSCHAVRALSEAVPLRHSTCAVAHYVLSDVDPLDAEDFFRRLTTYEMRGKADPVSVLMLRLQREVMAARARSVRPTAGLYLLLRTWNAIRTGEKLDRLLLFTAAGPARMPTPV